MRKHHEILLAPLALCLLAVACDLPAAPVGKDSVGTDGEGGDDPAEEGTSEGGTAEGWTSDGATSQGGTSEGATSDDGHVPSCADYDPCAGTEDQVGLYSGWICGPDADQWIISSHDTTCAEALANCLANEQTNAAKGRVYHCEWNGFEIHRTHDPTGYCEPRHGPATACEDLGPQSCVVPASPCEGQQGVQEPMVGWACNADVDAPEIVPLDPLSCEDALAVCAEYLAAYPGISLACLWNGKALMYTEAVAGECATLEPCTGQ